MKSLQEERDSLADEVRALRERIAVLEASQGRRIAGEVSAGDADARLQRWFEQTERTVLEKIVSKAPLAEILECLCRSIETQAGDLACVVLLMDPDGAHLRPGAAPSLPAEFARAVDGLAVGPSAGCCGAAAYRVEPVIVTDIAHDPLCDQVRAVLLSLGLRACWSTPILNARRRVQGTFSIYCRAARGPSPSEIALIDQAAGLAGIAIERRQAEEEGERVTNHLRLILEFTGEGIYGTNLQGRCTFANQTAGALLGYAPEEFIGQEMHRLIHHRRADGSAYPEQDCPIHRSFQTGQSFRSDADVFWRKDGTCFPVEYSAHPILMNETVTGCVIAFTDITTRREAEAMRVNRERQVRSLLEERERMGRDLHDDILQSLYAVGLGLERAKGLAMRGAAQAVAGLDHCIAQLNRVMGQVRAYVGRTSLAVAPEPSLADALTLLAEGMQSMHGLSVDLAIDPHATEALPEGHSEQMLSLAREALSNCARHARAKSVSLSLQRVSGGVRLIVRDDGVGFRTNQPQSGGHGLANMKARAEAMGATLRIASAPGAGTSIEVTVPT